VGRAPPPGQHVVQPGGDIGVVVKTENLRLGQRLGQLVPVPLGQAPHGHHPGTAAGGIEQFPDRLVFRRLDEAAGVDQDDTRVPVFCERPARFGQPASEFLGIHLVPRAAESHQADGTRPGQRFPMTPRHTGRLR